MKKYTIYRGIDNEIEFKGLKGWYFYYAAIGAVVTIMLTLFFHIIGIPLLISIIFLVTGLAASYFVTQHFNKNYGKWGFNKIPVVTMQPQYIVRRKAIRNTVKLRAVKRN
ncbi:transposase [Dyadobacter frigoris]|uniref:DUF4133 domain-containing protein n=1 Tax=Dyadobacter frigoris TaxID=2576211 RepID=UPI0024A20C23|nr:DUF4133 domain-containing protein [Dyadobacter frigoris]GLU56505.1 transposase [Dyadobacter frigoris]